METAFEVVWDRLVVNVFRAGKVIREFPFKILADGGVQVGSTILGPPLDPNKPVEHGDGSGGGGGGAGQSKRRTRRDGKNVEGEPNGERLSKGTFVPGVPPILSNSRGDLSEILQRERQAMGLAWRNGANGTERRLELVSYESRGGGKKKKPDGTKKKGKKKQKQGQPDDGGDGQAQRKQKKGRRNG